MLKLKALNIFFKICYISEVMKSFDDPQNKSIVEIFENNRYEVPRFQREYAWGTEQIKEFWGDLESIQLKDKDSIFFGNFIFLENADDSEERALTIIDGQQRLTTVQFLLIAIRTRAKALTRKNNDNTLQVSHINSLIEYYGSKFSNPVSTQIKRVKVEKTIRPLFDVMSEYKWDGVIPKKLADLDGRKYRKMKRKVEPVYNFFYEKIKDFDTQELSEILSSLEKIFVTKIVIRDPIEAFDIFERTNARGIKLAQSDLVKNLLFQKADEKIHDEIEEKWNEITFNASDKLSQLLKYYVVTTHGKTLKKDIFPILRDRVKDISPQILIKELSQFSLFYKMMTDEGSAPSEASSMALFCKEIGFVLLLEDTPRRKLITRSITAFQLFGITQVYPLIYSYIKCLHRSVSDIEEKNKKSVNEYLLNFIQRLENFHFVNTIICNNIGNQVETLYSVYSQKFNSVEKLVDLIETEKSFTEELLELRESRKTFIPKFTEYSYEDNDLNFIRYIFDRISNSESKGAQVYALYNPDKSSKVKECNIEHFYPRKMFESANDEVGTEYGNNIGNLLVIPLHSNSTFSNSSPNDKYKLINADPKHLINIGNSDRIIMQYENKPWDKTLIDKRAIDLATYGFDKTWIVSM